MNATMSKQPLALKAFKSLAPPVARTYRSFEPRWARHLKRKSVTGYDVGAYAFGGGDLETLTARNYEKSLRNLWKAEIQAPYLGIRDATELEKAGAEAEAEADEVGRLMEVATSETVRREFEEAFSPEERQAIGRIMSLIGHGEAYALYTSASLVSVVEGTGAKLGMAMQALEEAKHFIVLRAMLKTLGIDHPVPDSAYILFERVANASPYRRLFAMNVMIESFATTIFAEFADFPALSHIVRNFHMDEARHVGFPANYAQAGLIPKSVTNSRREKLARTMLVIPVIPLIFDVKPDFETIGRDCFGFFGRTTYKVARHADRVGLPVLVPGEEFVANLNMFFNAWTQAFEPERYHGYRDYTALEEGQVRREMLDREIEVFGDIFDQPVSQETA
ncbi:MAG: ferritin-like domain-containing protein [Solirubrobacterales bacterium]